jgi:stage II sporulation protein AA (anti-sigma F factor antagonist)
MDQLEIVATEDPFGLRLAGEIDMATAPALQGALLVALADGRPVTVDMKDVTFIDSSGLKVIVAAATETASGKALTVKDPSAVVRRVLELFGLEQVPQIRVVGGADDG